ncbi:MAG: tetratricopeptide repeat protein [Candidatus Hodarchaeota archaeon]
MGKFDSSLESINQAEFEIQTLKSALLKERTTKRFAPFQKRDFPALVKTLHKYNADLKYFKATNSFSKGNLEQAIDYSSQSLILYEALKDNSGAASCHNTLGVFHAAKGNFSEALTHYQYAHTLLENMGNKRQAFKVLNNIALIYWRQGELNQALEYLEQIASLYKEVDDSYHLARTLTNIAHLYWDLGDQDRAFDFLKQSLKLKEGIGNLHSIANTLFSLIRVCVSNNDIDLANNYFEQLQQIAEQEQTKYIHQANRLAQALLLKTSSRRVQKAKAQQIFQEITQEEIVEHELTELAFLSLCDLLLDELRESNDPEALEEINGYIQKLHEIAETQHSYSMLAEIHIIEAKLALLELNIQSARQSLTQAQALAEEKGLRKLAIRISNEHDQVLDQIRRWEELNEEKSSLTERIALAQLDNDIDYLLRQRPTDLPKVTEEEPVLFLILDRGGLSVFSKNFMSDKEVDDSLIGGFLTAIQSFSTTIFAQGLDRIKLKEYTLLMEVEEHFQLCYVFKGQTYAAKQRLKQFLKDLQQNDLIWKGMLRFIEAGLSLDKAVQTSLEELLIKHICSG